MTGDGTKMRELKTEALVLRRTNYGEADRILTLITPEGKISVMARGARREKSKLAGGIEIFSRTAVGIHLSKNSFGILTSARMISYFKNLVSDLVKLELAAKILKKVETGANEFDPETAVAAKKTGLTFFALTDQALSGLNAGFANELVEAWFLFNFAEMTGETVNLIRDTAGRRLDPKKAYVWNNFEEALEERLGGNIQQNEIKLMRMMLATPLKLIAKVKDVKEMLPDVLVVARAVSKT